MSVELAYCLCQIIWQASDSKSDWNDEHANPLEPSHASTKEKPCIDASKYQIWSWKIGDELWIMKINNTWWKMGGFFC